jgi:hypothetical protein
MKNKTKDTQVAPAWFKGQVYTEGDEVTNQFSGASYKLTAIELSIYDFIMGSQLMIEALPKMVTDKQLNDFRKALSWFRRANAEAYFVLLD